MKYFATIILLLSLNPIQACECVEFEYSGKQFRQFFNWYDKVFIGNLLENKNGVYKFEVIKGFKNCEFRDTLWGKYNNSCSITPSEEGLWIVYASIQDSIKNEIDIDACNSTRNLNSNRQYYYTDYDVNSNLYSLKKEQAEKLVELAILEELNNEETSAEKPMGMEDGFQRNISEPNKRTNKNWISLFALGLSIIAILMHIQSRMKASREQSL